MAGNKRRGPIIAIVALVLVALIGGTTWFLLSNREPDAAGTTANRPTPADATTTTTEPSGSPEAAPTGEQCEPMGAGFVPTQFEMPQMDELSPVLSLGRDEYDAAAAPPTDQPRTTGWFNEGPMAGSTEGKIVLTIHTYRQGGALGNEMYEEGPKQVEVGDRMLLRDENGNIACYEVSAIEKIWVDEYDPESKAVYDDDGDPQIAVVICWDFNWDTEDWDSRIVYYADPVEDGPSGTKRTDLNTDDNGDRTPEPNVPDEDN